MESVWMALVFFRLFPRPHLTPVSAAILADDADRHDLWMCDQLSDELVAHPRRSKGSNVSCCAFVPPTQVAYNA
jgi:hypothetical protein